MASKYQVDEMTQYRHLLLFCFNKKLTPMEVTKEICAVYGADAIHKQTACRWYEKFGAGSFAGSLSEVDQDEPKKLLEDDLRQTSRELAEQMGYSHTSI